MKQWSDYPICNAHQLAANKGISALRSLRGKYGLTMDEVYEATGIAKSTLSRLERGHKPKLHHARILADFYETDTENLFGRGT